MSRACSSQCWSVALSITYTACLNVFKIKFNNVVQASLKLMILEPQPPESWNDRNAKPYVAIFNFYRRFVGIVTFTWGCFLSLYLPWFWNILGELLRYGM